MIGFRNRSYQTNNHMEMKWKVGYIYTGLCVGVKVHGLSKYVWLGLFGLVQVAPLARSLGFRV